MRVTLMTDASVCGTTGASGYGFWCVCERAKLGGGGSFKAPLKDSYEAEYKAVVNALHECLLKGIILKGDTILIQVDNKGVVELLNSQRQPREDLHTAFKTMHNLKFKFNLMVNARHVKAHTGRNTSRHKSNEYCDATAGKYMNIARELLKNG